MRKLGKMGKMITNKNYISEIILNHISDLKDHYIKEYGPVPEWSSVKKKIFLLNADVVIESTLEKFKVKIHKKARENGLGVGVCKLQVFLTKKYLIGTNSCEIYEMNIDQRVNFNTELTNTVFIYLTEGTQL